MLLWIWRNMDDNKGYPAYQYSVFLKNGRDEQIVIRADDFIEFMELKKNVDIILEKRATATPATSEPIKSNIPTCPYHNKPMTLREGKFGKFWSCSTKLADDTWCKYVPSLKVEDMP